jgi:hypothetical protein
VKRDAEARPDGVRRGSLAIDISVLADERERPTLASKTDSRVATDAAARVVSRGIA